MLFLSVQNFAQTLDTLVYHGDQDEYINFVILGDGYRAIDHTNDLFKDDATDFMNAMLGSSPFSEYANFFNFFIVKRNSLDQGADHPGDIDTVGQNQYICDTMTVSTAYNSTFDYNGIHRLLAPQNTTKVYLDLANTFPAYDQIIMLVNDPCYGGSGGTIATSSTHFSANEIAIHEMAHSFGFLADEYYAGDQFNYEKPNLTMDNNSATNKWKDWIGSNGVGIYDHTCPYPTNAECDSNPGFDEYDEWYKPHQNCKMQYLGSNFCSVCKEALIDSIYSLADPFTAKVPNQTTVFSFNGSSIEYGSELILPISNYRIEWVLNGNVVSGRDNEFETWGFDDFPLNFNGLVLRVVDETPFSKKYLPASGFVFELAWVVQKVDLCTNTIDKFEYVNSYPIGSDAGQTTNDDFDWNVNSGPTGSSGTGPAEAYHETTYLYAEATGNFPKKTARIDSDCFDLRDLNKPKLSLAVHMFGSESGQMGTLSIQVSVTAGNGGYTELELIDKETGENWEEIEVDLEQWISPYTKFRLIATTGSGDLSDIAVDKFTIYDACPDHLTLTTSQVSGGTFRAKKTIKSTDLITSTSTYQAGTSVSLNGGFDMILGRTFTAQIGGCN